MHHATTSEIQLALRAPGAGWLGVLACVIDEASRDPTFDERQRQLVGQLLQAGPMSPALADAARACAASFEAALDEGLPAPAPVPTRPKLTLVGSDRG